MGMRRKDFLIIFLFLGVFILFFSGVNSAAAAGPSNTQSTSAQVEMMHGTVYLQHTAVLPEMDLKRVSMPL